MKICPYVQQVRALLEQKQVSYEVEHIDGANRPAWLMEASPDGGEVPLVFTDEGEVLYQSDAIVDYIDGVYGEPLLTGDHVQKARTNAFGRLASDNYLTQCSTQRSPDAETLTERLEDLKPIFAHADRMVSRGPYYGGATLNMADMSWLPVLHRTDLIRKHSGYDFLEPYPNLMRWRAAVGETGLYQSSVPSDFEEVFNGFYLNDETYLGRLGPSG